MKNNYTFLKPILSLMVVLFFFFITSCKSYYIASDFKERAGDDKIFAVLPFEMVFTGTKPEKMTDEDVLRIEEEESKAFMVSFYNAVLRSSKGRGRPIRINVQHFDKTMSVLESNGIDIRSSWKEDPGKLANILGVDAVVKCRIEKHRLMSELASYGIDMGTRILSTIDHGGLRNYIPGGIARSKDIKTSYSLIDNEGIALWSIGYNMGSDWRWTADEVIDHINTKSVKKFPYRK
ncbi:MAG: hypothetical protein ABJC12_07430 [Saprospiraceae bacterium]